MKTKVLLIIMLVLAGAFNVEAGNVVAKLNFGSTDISIEAGYESWTDAEVTYASIAGYGWTYDGAATHDYVVDPNERQVATFCADERENTTAQDPYTYRVDLPNGWYRIIFGIGQTRATQIKIFVGDSFESGSGDTIIDEALSVIDGKFLDSGEFVERMLEFEVTNGYLLFGFRRQVHVDLNPAILWSVVIEEGRMTCDDIYAQDDELTSDLSGDCYISLDDVYELSLSWLDEVVLE